jgi:hypothetical protein
MRVQVAQERARATVDGYGASFDKLRMTCSDKLRMTCFGKLRMTCFDKLRMTCFDKLRMTCWRGTVGGAWGSVGGAGDNVTLSLSKGARA